MIYVGQHKFPSVQKWKSHSYQNFTATLRAQKKRQRKNYNVNFFLKCLGLLYGLWVVKVLYYCYEDKKLFKVHYMIIGGSLVFKIDYTNNFLIAPSILQRLSHPPNLKKPLSI